MRVYFRECLQNGDSPAAVVVSLRPLLMAAYIDVLDCIVLLEFPQEIAAEYGLRDGSRLLAINNYRRDGEVDADLIPGPNDTQTWSGFQAIIAEFVSDDLERIEQRKVANIACRVATHLSNGKSARQAAPRRVARRSDPDFPASRRT